MANYQRDDEAKRRNGTYLTTQDLYIFSGLGDLPKKAIQQLEWHSEFHMNAPELREFLRNVLKYYTWRKQREGGHNHLWDLPAIPKLGEEDKPPPSPAESDDSVIFVPQEAEVLHSPIYGSTGEEEDEEEEEHNPSSPIRPDSVAEDEQEHLFLTPLSKEARAVMASITGEDEESGRIDFQGLLGHQSPPSSPASLHARSLSEAPSDHSSSPAKLIDCSAASGTSSPDDDNELSRSPRARSGSLMIVEEGESSDSGVEFVTRDAAGDKNVSCVAHDEEMNVSNSDSDSDACEPPSKKLCPSRTPSPPAQLQFTQEETDKDQISTTLSSPPPPPPAQLQQQEEPNKLPLPPPTDQQPLQHNSKPFCIPFPPPPILPPALRATFPNASSAARWIPVDDRNPFAASRPILNAPMPPISSRANEFKCAFCYSPLHPSEKCHEYETNAKRKRRQVELRLCIQCLQPFDRWRCLTPEHKERPCLHCGNHRTHIALCRLLCR